MKVLSGNSAIVEAVKQVQPDVMAGYPITPSTPILEEIASLISNDKLDGELIIAESDHSAMSACIGAAAAGGRVFGTSASQGLASMHEVLFIAASLRLPIVMAVTNRALSAPVNIHADHSDSMAQRDCGWIQMYSENAQEVYDNILQAFKISGHVDVKTPVMVGLDGFITSHTMTNITLEDGGEVDEFVGKPSVHYSLLDKNPVIVGSVDDASYYFEHKVNQAEGIELSRQIIKQIGKDFGQRFGRFYGLFEEYKLEDAEYAILTMGSSAGTAKEAVDELRSKGEKVGLLKLRVYRPFPYNELKEAVAHLKSLAVLDRVLTPGSYGGPLFNETRSALYELEQKPAVLPYVYGLGGRDINVGHFHEIFKEMGEKTEEQVEAGRSKNTEAVFINLRQ
ncbi:MAG: pyruvate ferredoxin oxidoreductase [bacterium]|nr:pyruvate ferredoxin oxidoreductase [bacterium]